MSRDKMKIVVCQNCGAKYQLDDSDDINAFECSICAGSLEEFETYSSADDSAPVENSSQDASSDSLIVYCKDCGLRFQIDKNDSIDDFECTCGGSLDYLSNMDSTSSDSDINYSMDNPLTQNELEIDEIIPIHAEPGYQAEEYYDDYAYDDDIYSYGIEDDSVEEYDSDDEEIVPYGSIYDSTLGDVDEIIPIHAEKRYMETSRDIASGFAYKPSVDDDEEYYEIAEEDRLVQITDIPEDEMPESPVSLSRQELSEEDQKLFARVQNEMVFDSPEEYEAYKLARYKYYTALSDILKDDFLKSMDDEFYKNSSVKRLIKKGEESVKRGNLTAKEEDALVSKETVELMKSQNRNYEPKKTYADVYILIGAFALVVSAVYYFFVSRLWYALIGIALGVLILSFGLYKKHTFNNYITRGRIIRERLLALPNDFYVFYAVQPPQSKDIINHVVVGPTGVFTILSKRYDSKDYKDKVKADSETDAMLSDSASIQNYIDKKHTLELQTDYDDNQSRFQFGNEEIHFVNNSQIKRKALELNEELAIFLDNKGFSGIYIEPLIGFVNDDLAILNVILTNEDLFIDELFNKMIRGQRRIDELTVAKIARLLSYYSADCSTV